MKNTPTSAETKIQLILRDPLHTRHRPPTKASRRNVVAGRRAR